MIWKDITRFNGAELERENGLGVVAVKQSQYIKKIGTFCFKENLCFEDFCSIQAKYTYAIFSTVPDILIYITIMAQITQERYIMEQEYVFKLMKKGQAML